jgi:hypothetical protein
MKWLLFVLPMLSFGWQWSSYGQGTLVFNNLGANNGKVGVANLVDGQVGPPRLLDQDLNFRLVIYPFKLGGSPLFERSWLLSDGTAKGINVGPGLFADPSHSVFVLPGNTPGTGITVLMYVWEGNFPTLDDAVIAGAGTANAGFPMLTGSIEAPPVSLDRMPIIGITLKGVPEPQTVSLAIFGTALLVLDRLSTRPKRKTR